MDIKEFDAMLAGHDWTYTYSDDYSYFVRGEAQRNAINEQMRNHPEWKPLFDLFNEYIFQRPATTREQFLQRREELLRVIA